SRATFSIRSDARSPFVDVSTRSRARCWVRSCQPYTPSPAATQNRKMASSHAPLRGGGLGDSRSSDCMRSSAEERISSPRRCDRGSRHRGGRNRGSAELSDVVLRKRREQIREIDYRGIRGGPEKGRDAEEL